MNFGRSKLIEDHEEQQMTFNVIQSFICYLYKVAGLVNVDAARLQIFIDSYTVSDVNEAFNKKNCEILTLVAYHLAKVRYSTISTSKLYMLCMEQCSFKNPTTYEPVNNGWILENGQYHFK